MASESPSSPNYSNFQNGPIDSGFNSQSRKEFMNKVKANNNLMNASEFINRITYKCFDKCIGNPGSELSTYERNCSLKCTDNYFAAWLVIANTFKTRLDKENELLEDDGEYTN